MAELWKNIIYEFSLVEKIIEYYENKKKENKAMKESEKKDESIDKGLNSEIKK